MKYEERRQIPKFIGSLHFYLPDTVIKHLSGKHTEARGPYCPLCRKDVPR